MKDQYALNLVATAKKHQPSYVVQISFILLLLLSAHIAEAQTSFTGVNSMALGGTGRAAVRQEEVGLLNPAALVHMRGYAVNAAYRKMEIPGDGKIENTLLHLSESGTDSLFPLAITYLRTRNFYLPYVNREENIHFSTAALIIPNLSIGLDVSKNTMETDNISQEDWNGSLGLLFIWNKNIGIGLVYYNLLDSDIYYLERRVALGTSFLYKDFLKTFVDIEYQVGHNLDDELTYMLGIEHALNSMLELRLGAKLDDFRNKNYWTAGAGFKGPKLGLSYAFEKNFALSTEYAHSFDLKLTF